MLIDRLFFLWEVFSDFAENAWTFLNTTWGSFLANYVENHAGDGLLRLIRFRAANNGFNPWELEEYYTARWGGELTMLELFLGAGVVTVLLVKVIKLLFDY